MLLTVELAAVELGISPRAVRARLQRGELVGRKVDGRWCIPRESLPLTESQHRSLQARVRQLHGAVDRVAPPGISARRDRRRRSLVDLDVWRSLHAIQRNLAAQAQGRDAARAAIDTAAAALALGFYEYATEPRVAALRKARAELAVAVSSLLAASDLPPPDPVLGWVDQLEQDVLPMLGGMVRAAERRRRPDP